jgi:DNA-binding response OmpR family regulator
MKTILIVEDEPAYLKLLHDQLVQSGYEVIDAPDGEEGLKIALAKKPDLILLDILMPKVDGLKMLAALRASDWGKHVPVFILTNVAESKEISEGMNSRVNRYIVKSEMTLEDLLSSIKVYLK